MLSEFPALMKGGFVLVLVQLLAAVPWVLAVDLAGIRSWLWSGRPGDMLARLGAALAGVLIGGAALGMVLGKLVQDPERLTVWGGGYGVLLQAQLSIDFFVLVLATLLLVWPKGAAVALASFREGLRHPMFWFLIILAVVLMIIMPILPYFTFGEDIKMVKDLGYSTIMLVSTVFGVLAASMLISEEIEGRTAITLMSKPISRRQFLLGKYTGLLLSALAMTAALMLLFDGVLLFKPYYDREPVPQPTWLATATPMWEGRYGETMAFFLRGIGWWFDHAWLVLPGIVLGFCQVMVLLAVAVALATRLPMVVNVNACLAIFFLGNLSPILVQVAEQARGRLSDVVYKMVLLVARVFDTLLPGLEHFNLGTAIARDTPPDTGPFVGYVGTVVLYAVLYSAIALFLGLILFEDRDLA